jgi:hypothetical protein
VSLFWALLASLPSIYWTAGVESAPALRQAGIERPWVPPERAAAWRNAGFAVVPVSPAQLRSREKLPVPGILERAGVASPTRSPWIVASGWRFRRKGGGSYSYDLPAGKATLAAAEAFAYGAEALLKVDAADLPALGSLLSLLRELPPADLPEVADLGVVDDGTPLLGEVMNLLARRNLLFRVVGRPDPGLPLNVKVGTREHPRGEAANPDAFALAVRRQLTDERRSLRVYGSEVVIARLTGDGHRARLHLINYGGGEISGLRIRLRGEFPEGEAFVAGQGRTPLEDHLVAEKATELSLPALGVYAVVDLRSR